MMKILVFGNKSVEMDSIAPRLIDDLQKEFPEIEFKEFDTVEELDEEGEELIILDTVVGIEKITVFDDLDKFVDSPTVSLHDFDLPIYLKLLMKLGKVKKVRIIGIPSKPETGNSKLETGNRELLTDLVPIIRKIEQ
jgi:hypothetical protein